MSHLKILHIMRLNPRAFRSFEEYLLLLAKRLSSKEYKCFFVFIKAPPEWIKEKFENAGAKVFEMDLNKFGFESSIKLFRLIKTEKINIIHTSFMHFFTLYNIIFKLAGASKIIHHQHGAVIKKRDNIFKEILKRIRNVVTTKWIYKILAVSDFIGNQLRKNYNFKPDKIKTIYNGININRFSVEKDESIYKEYKIPDGAKIVIAIAYLTQGKGIDYLLNAVPSVIEETPNTYFFIVGDGPCLTKYKDLVKNLNVEKNVIFTGLRNDVERYLKISDIAVIPSNCGEAFSLVAAESMCSGLPVIASIDGGIPEIVVDGVTGILVHPADPRAISRAIKKLLQNPALSEKLGKAGRERVINYFSLDRMINNIISIYEA